MTESVTLTCGACGAPIITTTAARGVVPCLSCHDGGADTEHARQHGDGWDDDSADVCSACGRTLPLSDLTDVNANRRNAPRPEYVCHDCH